MTRSCPQAFVTSLDALQARPTLQMIFHQIEFRVAKIFPNRILKVFVWVVLGFPNAIANYLFHFFNVSCWFYFMFYYFSESVW